MGHNHLTAQGRGRSTTGSHFTLAHLLNVVVVVAAAAAVAAAAFILVAAVVVVDVSGRWCRDVATVGEEETPRHDVG